MKQSVVHDCLLVGFDVHHHDKGNLTVVSNSREVPFEVKRVYYLYDVPSGESRGGHAHYGLQQLIVAASGSFDVVLDDGREKKRFTLNRPDRGLLITPGMWRELENFSGGSVCLVLASDEYDEADYIRSYEEFLNYKAK